MKIKIRLEFTTQMRYGGNRGVIVMFTRTLVQPFHAQDVIELNNTGHIEVDKLWSFQVNMLKDEDSESLSCFCSGYVNKNLDDLVHYKNLVQQGWKPNIENAHAIRSDGYQNFYPEKF